MRLTPITNRTAAADRDGVGLRSTEMQWCGLRLVLAFACLLSITSAQTLSFNNASNSPIAVGLAPSAIAVGDFNRDGLPDLAIANANDGNVTILLNNGDGTFSAAANSPFPTNQVLGGTVPLALAVADVNGDGLLDLVVATVPNGILSAIGLALTGHVGGGVSILIGDGTGGFHGACSFGTPCYNSTGGDLPISVAVGDFNGDGIPDIAATNLNSSTVSVFLGSDGKGNFNAPTTLYVGNRPAAVTVADLNGDGKADLIIANADDGNVSVLLGRGDGNFAPAANSPIATGVRPAAIAVADLNGDGKLDLAVANLGNSTVAVLLGDGTGSFSLTATVPVGRYPASIVAADFNNDGKIDLAVANRLNEMVSVLPGNGDGTFAMRKDIPVRSSPHALVSADFNRDGLSDLAVVNTDANSVSVLLNRTDIIAPTTTATTAPAANANGWNNTAVNVTLSAVDNTGGSGVKEIHYALGTSTPVVISGSSTVVNVSNEGLSTLKYFAVDNAGNIEKANNLVTRIDLTPPSITPSQSPPANAAGWNNTNVSVSFACSDNLSGVATCSPTVTLTGEGANQTVTGTATDQAGNSASATAQISIDKTPPTLSMPALASSYTLNSKATLTFSALDALSGVASVQAILNGNPVVSGTTATFTHLGVNTFTLTAADIAGNSTSQTATFSVNYNFIGFLPPVPNIFKLGSTVPLKFQLTDANGAFISNALVSLTVQMLASGTPVGTPIDATPPGAANVGNLFRYDSTGNQYIYNLSTAPLSTGTWQVQAHLDDGSVHTVAIGLR